MIIHKHEVQAKMLSGLKEKEQVLVTLQEEKFKNQDEFKAYLKKRYVVMPPLLTEIAAEVTYQHDALKSEKLALQAAELIVQKVAHAD